MDFKVSGRPAIPRRPDRFPHTWGPRNHTSWRWKEAQIYGGSHQWCIQWEPVRNQGAYRPPTKWRPVKCLTSGFGAVRLTRVAGMKLLPRPDFGGPSSMFQDDGASTEVTGTLVSSKARITAGNGSRTSPEKLKPGNHVRTCNPIFGS